MFCSDQSGFDLRTQPILYRAQRDTQPILYRALEHNSIEIRNLYNENYDKYITLFKQPKLDPYFT